MKPEWSLPVIAARIPEAGQDIAAEADEAVRAAIAARLGEPAIAALGFSLRLVPRPGGVITATGRLHARLTRICVVTLEPFECDSEIPLALRFVAGESEGGDLDPDAPDEVAMEAGVLDVAEAAVQSLSLALDPWPHAPGAALPAEAAEAGGTPRPFAALAPRARGGNA